jgi:hypothetical protein
MQFYDEGTFGRWLQSPLVYMVPRFFWPDKPTIESPGRIFNQLASGYVDARVRVGITVYADGYWQLGWVGAVLYPVLMGLVLGVTTRLSYLQVQMRSLVFLPAVLLAMLTAALGPNGFLQNSVLGGLPIYLGYLLLISLAVRIFVPPKQPTTPQARSVYAA